MMTAPPDPSESQDRIARLLRSFANGDRAAGDELFAIVYKDLRRLAAYFLRGEDRANSLSPTALVNEAYLRLFGAHVPTPNDHHHFLALCSSVMRRLLVDRARKRRALKRETPPPLDLTYNIWDKHADPDLILNIDQALIRFAAFAERPAQVVEMHYFGGLEYEEISQILGISIRTVRRDLDIARGWLASEV